MANARCLSGGLTALAAVDRVFGAVCDGIDVLGGAANGVARSGRQGSANQRDGQDLLKHVSLLSVGVTTRLNAGGSPAETNSALFDRFANCISQL